MDGHVRLPRIGRVEQADGKKGQGFFVVRVGRYQRFHSGDITVETLLAGALTDQVFDGFDICSFTGGACLYRPAFRCLSQPVVDFRHGVLGVRLGGAVLGHRLTPIGQREVGLEALCLPELGDRLGPPEAVHGLYAAEEVRLCFRAGRSGEPDYDDVRFPGLGCHGSGACEDQREGANRISYNGLHGGPPIGSSR